MANEFKLPDLPYPSDALEPAISKEIMILHHDKHHAAYVNNLNKAMVEYAAAEAKNDLAAMIALESAINFNGGGHINHSIFWTNLVPTSKGGGKPPEGALAEAINKQFGSLDKLIEIMSAKGAAVQGSGWVWLGYCKKKNQLEVVTCANQDPLVTKGLVPLLGIDVWEHAYYPQYKNVRPDYIKAIWSVINWKDVADRYAKAKSE